MYKIDDFIAVINDMIYLFNDMTAVQNEKRIAASDDDILQVENCMNREQAQMLKLRGLDKKREAIQEELSYEDYTFRQIIEQQPPIQAQELKTLYNKLNDTIAIFRCSSENAKKVIEVNLHFVETTLSNLEAQIAEKQKGPYSKQKEEKKQHHSFKSIKI